MAASGASLLRQRPLHTGRAKTLLHPKILAQLGLRPGLRPTQATLCSASVCSRKTLASPQTHRRRGRQLVVRAVAMVNVDFASPSLLLGTMLIGCGVLLLNLRNFQNKVSRDADIVVAAMVSIVGSTLIFQGWRLDPLLLLCQALTTSVAFWYGMETFRLRSKEADLPPPQLPPGMGPEGSPLDAVQQAAAAAAAQQQQQQYYQAGAGFPPAGPGTPYLPPGSDSYYPWADPSAAASTSGRAATGPYGETIQYDYYGNPILPQEPAYSNAGYNTYGTSYGAPGSDPYGGGGSRDSGEGMYGAAFGAAAGTAAASAGVGYDMRGPSPESGPSYAGPSSASAGPYAAPPPPPPPGSSSASTQFDDRQSPAASSSSSSYFGAGVAPAGSPLGGTFDNSLYDGFGAAPSTGAAVRADSSSWGPVPGAGSGAAAGSGAGVAAGASGGSGSRGPSGGRLDLFERVDDWE
ncbi:hypothetical protein PLESTM_001125000 [Pleodorina starrii]|nr:hypothetical protein PLESTM_001125000 [Pleodorina starrii]